MTNTGPGRWRRELREIEGSLGQVEAAPTLDALEALRLDLLGRKGRLTLLLRDLKDLPLEDRRALGRPANELRSRVESALESRRAALARGEVEREVSALAFDPTRPATPSGLGSIHPLTRLMDEMASILSRLGFAWAEGPLVETDYYNFGALNIPADHPARDMHDTFYLEPAHPPPAREGPPPLPESGSAPEGFAAALEGGAAPPPPPDPSPAVERLLLRTHTSPVQIRRMESVRPPLRIMAPGRVFRHEAVDASHSAVFHQVEGLYVDRQVSMADLKGTLETFLKCLFGPQTATRFRPSYFPFTEPSAEMDIQCLLCGGSGCGVCKRSGWLEVLGAGLVHANVFSAVDYDPRAWSGFAFGLGVERVAMLRYRINDIRLFYQNDVRFLEQFP